MKFICTLLLSFVSLIFEINAQCPSTLTLTVVSIADANCPDNGTVTLGGNGVGNVAVTFKIVSGPSQTGLTQSSAIFNSLTAGTYLFEAKCLSQTVQVSATVNNNYTPISTSFGVNVSNLCTNYVKGGTISVTGISGGRAPIEYSFIKNSQANYNDALSVYSGSAIYAATDTGIYQVRVKDACGIFITRTINIESFTSPASFANARIAVENVACDSAGLYFWMHNDDYEGVNLTDYSKLKFTVYESGAGCIPGALIKTFELQGTDESYFVIPRRDVVIEVTTLCGDVRRTCYNYPEIDSVITHWIPLVIGCGTGPDPYTFSLKHTHNEYTKTPFTIKLYNNTTNTLLSTQTYNNNWNCDTYANLPFDTYRIEIEDFCGRRDTLLLSPPTGSIQVAPVNAGTNVDKDCTFQNGKVTVKLMLTGLISNHETSILTISSGPDNIGKSSKINEYLQYTFTELTPGATYGFELSNGCSLTTVNFTVPINTWQEVQFSMAPNVTQQCGGTGTILADVQYNGWGSFKIELWQGATKITENNSGTFSNVAPGLYTLKAIAEQGWCTGPTTASISDTIRVYDDGTPPQLLRQFGYICESGGLPTTSGRININVGGFGPFKYEIRKISPVMDPSYSTVATNAPGNYSIGGLEAYAVYNLLITDNCGKSTVSQVVVGEIGNLAFESAYNPCAGNPYLISAPIIAGATYTWVRKSDNVQLSSTHNLYFAFYNSSYDGDYVCTITINGGCLIRQLDGTINSTSCGFFLPVRLTSIGIKNKDCVAELSWSTATELNGYYEIQQSTDGTTFSKIGEVRPAKSGGNMPANYTFLSPSLTQGKYYFRLVMIENNGKRNYTSVLHFATTCNKNNLLISVYPNPVFDNKLTFRMIAPDKTLVTLTVLNTLGAQVKSIKLNLVAGQSNYTLPVTELANGVYFVKVTGSGGFTEMIKVVKQ